MRRRTTTTTAARLFQAAALLLVAVAAVRPDPFGFVDPARLARLADDFRRDRPAPLGGQVRMRLRPDGAPSSWRPERETLCGYKFAATAADGRAPVVRHLPAAATFVCDGRDEYRVHVARAPGGPDERDATPAAAAAYDDTASLGPGARVDAVELEAAGWTAVPVTDLCFGFADDAAAAGVRAFCADVNLLNACLGRTEPDMFQVGDAFDVQLKATRRYTCRKIVFRDVRALARGFESLLADVGSEAARHEVCGRIDCVKAEDRRIDAGCLAERMGGAPTPLNRTGDDGLLFKYTDGRFAVASSDDDSRCERVTRDSDGAGPQTSGGPALNPPGGFCFFFIFFYLLLFHKSVAARPTSVF